MILAAALAAHWFLWTPHDVQVGIAIGPAGDERLLTLVPAEGCQAGVKFYDGRYGDFDKAVRLLEKSKVCDLVRQRAAAAVEMAKERETER